MYGRFYHFGKEVVTYPDGIRSNLNFEKVELAEPAWRFIDLTPHVEYLSSLMNHVITHEMHQESQYLKKHDLARDALKEIIDMPNEYADRIIRSIQQNRGAKSNKLVKEFALLADDEVWQQMIDVVVMVFGEMD